MNKQLWTISTRTPFGYDHYKLYLDSTEFGKTSGRISYGDTTVDIDEIEYGENFIRTQFRTDIPISENVEISISGLEEQMFGHVNVGPHTTVEAFATKAPE